MPLVPPFIESLRPYSAGRSSEGALRLASNENPLGSSPLAIEAARKVVEQGFNRYPDGGLALRKALASRFGTKLENVIAGSGSESLLATIIRTFLCDDDEVLTTEGAFIGFRVLANSRGVPYRMVPYKNYRYDLDAIARAMNDRTKLIYLANPNNPTGTISTREEFDEFYRHVPERVLIILDEAYFEYACNDPSYPDSMHYRYDNVICLRTFSKAYGLAGLRVGYAFAHEDLITNLLKVKLPFEPSAIAQAAAIAALEDVEFLRRTLDLNAQSLARLTQGLRELGLSPIASHANFVMIPLESASAASELNERLLAAGIAIRPLAAFDLPHCVRISTGTLDDTESCLAAIQREVPVCQP